LLLWVLLLHGGNKSNTFFFGFVDVLGFDIWFLEVQVDILCGFVDVWGNNLMHGGSTFKLSILDLKFCWCMGEVIHKFFGIFWFY
jgi:hypothetical protein